jgi:hypothetical protein
MTARAPCLSVCACNSRISRRSWVWIEVAVSHVSGLEPAALQAAVERGGHSRATSELCMQNPTPIRAVARCSERSSSQREVDFDRTTPARLFHCSRRRLPIECGGALEACKRREKGCPPYAMRDRSSRTLTSGWAAWSSPSSSELLHYSYMKGKKRVKCVSSLVYYWCTRDRVTTDRFLDRCAWDGIKEWLFHWRTESKNGFSIRISGTESNNGFYSLTK